jgi:hypothetical protein
MAAEAPGLLRQALVLGCRAAAEGDPGEEEAALLAAVYGQLIPASALTKRDAHALSRAGELARVFGTSPAAPPEGLVDGLARDARDLLARVRERLSGVAAAEPRG